MKQLLLLSYLIVKTLMLTATSADGDLQKFVKKADSCYEILNYALAKAMYAEAISIVNKEADPYLFSYLLNQYASSLFWLDEMNEAEAACRRSLNFITKTLGPLHPYTAEAHINLGAQKFVSGTSGIIAEHFYEATFILEHYYKKPHPKSAKAYEWLGVLYESMSDTVNARHFIWKSLDLYERSVGRNHPDVAELYRYIGLFYKRFDKPDSALFYFNKAKLLFDDKFGEANFHSVKCLNNISDVYGNYFNQWGKTEIIYHQCLELIKAFKSPNRYTHAMTLYRMVDNKAKNNDYFQALNYMNQILQLYYPNFENQSIFDNPEIANSNLVTVPKLVFIYKANILIKLADIEKINKYDYLKHASDCYVLLDKFIDEIRSNLVGHVDWLNFSNRHAKLYYMMALHELRLFEFSKNEYHVHRALYYLEKKKLSETIGNPEESLFYADDPNYETLNQIIELRKEINTLKSHGLLSFEKETVERQVVQKTLLLDATYAKKKLRESTKEIDDETYIYQIKEIQHRLHPDEIVLFYADNTHDYKQIPYSLITIAINKEQIKFTEIQGQETFLLASEYYNLMATNQATDSIHVIGGQLYDLLISPVSHILKRNIIIQPSSFLSLLSFESLPDLSRNAQPSLLIENHLVWKIFSLKDIVTDPEPLPNHMNDSLLAVAPIFNETKIEEIALLTQRDASLINLAGAVKECNLITKYFGTLLLSGLNVSKSQFKEISNRFPYIHISTHGVPVGDDPEIVQLAFNPAGDGDNGWLNFYEILNLNLNADLVVLSACRTGVGKRNNGEGNLNLAWAFRKAGAKSAIISLWDVSDYASSQIMPAFYEYLSKGYSKPEALRLAKLSFIKNHDQMAASPYFWAAFDFVGSHENIMLKTGRSNHVFAWVAITGSIFLVLILLLLLKKSKGTT
jgi:CHAT domain-containing protein